MRRSQRVLAIMAVLLLTISSFAFAAPSKGTEEEATYLVGFKEGHPGLKGLQQAGFVVTDDWEGFIGAAAVRTNKNGLKQLEKLPFVEYVEEDVERKARGYADNLPITWGLDAVNAPEAWNQGAKGQGIKLCVLDTGIDYSHPEFVKADGTSVIKGSKNFVKDRHPDATDGDGHGTHVAGTIAAQGKQVWGVAPDVELYVARVLGDDGYGKTSWIISGVKWCDSVGADILSMSLGGGRPSKTEERAYNTLYAGGALTIAAAGNDGDSTISYPAGYENVISVAAVSSDLMRASFSQYNSDVELAGPGVSTLSSVPVGTGVMSMAMEADVTYPSNGVEYATAGSVTGPLVECGLADTTTSCTGAPTTGPWIAMVSRGAITFADKATNVMAQGASAMILANNDQAYPDDVGSFTFGSAGSWIPAVSVSYNSGVAIREGGLATGSISLEAWDYAYFQGTSMATPHVSAVAALAWSANPALPNTRIREILQSTAMDLGDPGRDVEYGFGLVQADAAATAAAAE